MRDDSGRSGMTGVDSGSRIGVWDDSSGGRMVRGDGCAEGLKGVVLMTHEEHRTTLHRDKSNLRTYFPDFRCLKEASR